MKLTKNYQSVYQDMFKCYGKQNWWPAESEWEMMIGAILVQNTNWTNVEQSIMNLNTLTHFKPQKLRNLTTDQLIPAIQRSGFYKNKSKTIEYLLAFFEEYNFDIELVDEMFDTEDLRKALLSIKGIGFETADDILLYAFNRPVFIADTYSRRLVSYLENQLLDNMSLLELQEFHALIDEYGMTYISKLKS